MNASADGSDPYHTDIALYRTHLREYLRRLDWAPEWRTTRCDSAEATMAHHAVVLARLYEAGWNRYGWPIETGGLGGSEVHRAIYFEELGHALLPVPVQHWTLETLGPALIAHAPSVAADHLPAYLRGDEWWGQCFSEPEAGSDLAALRTRALPDGAGDLIVSGQKIWTSQGPTATRLLVLARTGTAGSRHRGLTMLLVDADTPGVTIRPIALASGRRELAEVFFDQVRVPRSRVVGAFDGGWAVAMHLMQYERGTYGYGVLTTALTELALLRPHLGCDTASASLRERFARIYVAVVAAQARTAQSVRALARGDTLGPQSSIDKLLFSNVEKDVHDLKLDVLARRLVAGTKTDEAIERDSDRAQWWYSRAATIMGGTADIQRSIIADHVLCLPKETR